MIRSGFLRAAAVLSLAGGLLIAAEPQTPAPPAAAPKPKASGKVGMFMVSTVAVFNPIPKSLQLMDFWFPMPFEDDHQKIYQRFLFGPYNAETAELPDHSGIVAYMQGAPRGGLPMQVRITFYLERFESLPPDFSKATAKPTDDERKIHERWTLPDMLVAVDKEMRGFASKIAAGKKKPLERARAFYDHLVTNIQSVTPYELQGVGYGNAKFTLTQGKGNDIDLASAFVGLCRAAGIPARTYIGIRMPDGFTKGTVSDYHSWAEFYLDGVGWVPVDPGDGRKSPSRRAFYFGGLDERRVAISIGRDVKLIPPQNGQALNYWIKAYWEGDQKPMPDPYVEATFEEVTEMPGKPTTSEQPPGSP